MKTTTQKQIKTFCFFIVIFFHFFGYSQPNQFSYQAVIRNAGNALVTNQNIGLKVSILSLTPNGTVLYSEYHLPSTNSNGLVSVQIGAGTMLLGNFAAINWANGPFFIKTDIDPTGPGTNYTISGTSQLLSVPFALHAKKATTPESIGASMTQSARDLLSPTIGFTVFNTTTNRPNYFNGTNWMNFDNTSARTLSVGMSYQGGVIAYLLQPGDLGYDVGVSHGIIAAAVDQAFGSGANKWSGSNTFIGTTSIAIGTGLANTTAIVNNTAIEPNAARQCFYLTLNGYTDWYLPSIGELEKLYINRTAIGGFDSSVGYWSSTEDGMNIAKFWNFNLGNSDINIKSYQYNVRAVRSF